jgi:hypothetical protein
VREKLSFKRISRKKRQEGKEEMSLKIGLKDKIFQVKSKTVLQNEFEGQTTV